MRRNPSDVTTIELYFRAGDPTVWDYQGGILERAEDLDDYGILEDLRVRQCGAAAALSGDIADAEYHRCIAKTVEEAGSWARERPRDVVLPFERTVFDSTITDSTYRMVRLPAAFLLAYSGKNLEAVFPHVESDGASVTIADYLACLEAELPGERDGDSARTAPK